MDKLHNDTPVVAIYARYSCLKQNDTSLEDQIRRCKELATHKLGDRYECLVYQDAALSGNDDDVAKRDGYLKMLADWKAGKFQVLLVDEFSRLSRDALEQAKLLQLLENNHKRRLITADGTDTIHRDWQLPLGLKGMMAQHEVRNLRHRTQRGMLGQLERGYMIASPAYGYDIHREYDGQGNRLGSRWVINPEEAKVVREIFNMRVKGHSMHQIAGWLNTNATPCRRKPRKADGGYWRPAAVKNMLQNTIYKGVFVWHGSTTYKKTMRDRAGDVETKAYIREELRLVDDEIWNICNQNRVSRSGYGGGKHAFTSLFTCGCCDRSMAVTAKFRCRSIYCPECMVAKGTNDEHHRMTQTVSVEGVELLLKTALQSFMTADFVDAFRQSLKLRLTGGAQEDLKECEERVRKLRASQDKLSRMIAGSDSPDDLLEARYQEGRARLAQVQAQYDRLQSGLQALNTRALEAQMKARPEELLDSLFSGAIPESQLRAILSRLFPVAVFEGKDGRYTSFFRLHFAIGAAFSAVTGNTDQVVNTTFEAQFELRYVPASRGERSPYWTVRMLGDPLAVTSD